MDKTPSSICRAVALDFKARKITHQMAGEAIGKSKAVISTQISGNKPFSKTMAELFAEAFGYNTEFLLYGRGPLRREEPEPGPAAPADRPDPVLVAAALDICETLLHLTGDNAPTRAWDALMSGDSRPYSDLMREHAGERGVRQNIVLAKIIAGKIRKNL